MGSRESKWGICGDTEPPTHKTKRKTTQIPQLAHDTTSDQPETDHDDNVELLVYLRNVCMGWGGGMEDVCCKAKTVIRQMCRPELHMLCCSLFVVRFSFFVLCDS